MAKSAFSKVMWVGRATVFMVGLAVILALLFGAATTALGATGASLILGKPNAAETPTSLVSTLSDAVKPAMGIHNKSGGPALNLGVASEQAPIRVNAAAGTATNLSADELDGKDASEFAPKAVEAWHEVGTQGEPPFSGVPTIGYGWANFDEAHNTVGFYKDPYGVVHLKGVVKWTNDSGFNSYCGSYGDIFTLPAGYRPPVEETQLSMKNDTLSRINIETDGEVTICDSRSTQKGDWYSLDGMTFRAAN